MSLVWELQEIEKRHALLRVLASATFNGSEQLKPLLRFLCEREIAGLGDRLSEYTVATEGLGRPCYHSLLEDATVRNRIHILRRRLDQYYEVENPEDPVRIALPEESCCPVFQRNQAAARRPWLEVIESTTPSLGTHRQWMAPIPTVLLVVSLA